jgi:probable rRNA maturation factor
MPEAPSQGDGVAEPEHPQPLTVVLVWEAGDWSGFGDLEAAVLAAANALATGANVTPPAPSIATIVLADDVMVRGLNATYRGKDVATNVLSFPYQSPPGAGRQEITQLGDIVLAADTVRNEAAESGIEPSHHLQHLVVHGLLHLMGYDHQADREAEEMERLETEILARIGVADPYSVAAA